MKHDQHATGPLEPQDVEELLPWYVTGRVSREEARGIEAALKTMPDLADKLSQAQREREAVARSNEAIEAPPPETLQRLLQQVETTRQGRVGRIDGAGESGAWLQDAFNRKLVWQGAFAVACIAIVALGTTLYLTPSGEPFMVATGMPPADGGPSLLVTFQQSATSGDITKLLTDLGAVVVDGPKPDGAFVVQLQGQGDAELAAARSAFEARKDLVATVLPGS